MVHTFAECSFVTMHTTAGKEGITVHTCTSVHARIADTFVNIYSICEKLGQQHCIAIYCCNQRYTTCQFMDHSGSLLNEHCLQL